LVELTVPAGPATMAAMAARRRIPAAVVGLSLVIAASLAAPLTTAAATKPFRFNLGERADFVRQYDPNWCIGASMQMMLNIMGLADDTTMKRQEELIELARTFRRPTSFNNTAGTTTSFKPRGASGRGWAMGLTQLGGGPYMMTSASTFEDALKLLARSMRATGRPAGIGVWTGNHAWVVSGFEATADPATSASFDVTALVVLDPWYPRSTRAYGASPKPMTTMPVRELKKEYLPWSRPNRTSSNTGRFTLLIPYEITRIITRVSHATWAS
jgi:hypothetical protein